MDAESGMLLMAMTLFAAKHFVADFALQTRWMLRGKGIYGHPGGVAHAGLHMLGSLPALAVLGLAPIAILLLVLAEGILHYLIDWGKEQLTQRLGTSPQDRKVWLLLGVDQLLHYLTYIGLIFIALRFGV